MVKKFTLKKLPEFKFSTNLNNSPMETIKIKSVLIIALLFTGTLALAQGSCASPYNLGTVGTTQVCANFATNGTTGSAPCAGSGYGGSGGATYVKFCTGSSLSCINFNMTNGGSLGNFAVTVYSTNCSTSMDAQCLGNSGSGATFNTATPAYNAYQPNSCYIARIWTANAGGFSLCAQAMAPPNDYCTSPTQISPTAQSLTNYCMTAGSNGSYTEPAAGAFCAGSLENNAWYSITTLSTCLSPCTVTVTISNINCSGGGAGFQVGYFTGSCSSLTNIGCSSGSGGTVTATISNLSPNQTVLIGIDGNAGANCTYSMSANNTVPLPIEMMSFDLVKKPGVVVANWSTASEKDNAYFVVEKTEDGSSFTEVGRVTGNETTSETHNYSFSDDNPTYGVSYYRIKQVDRNGNFSYSHMRAIEYKDVMGSNFEVVPNPSESMAGVALTFNKSITSDFVVSVFDISGTLLYSRIESIKGNKIELPNFEKGFYIVQVTGSDFNKTKRMIIK
jgi:hypothetical protein